MKWKSSRPDLIMLLTVGLLIIAVTAGFTAFTSLYEGAPGANDFAGRWQAAKNLIYTQASPLSDETALQIDVLMAYRHTAEWKENTSFFLPYFSIIPFLPFGLIPQILNAAALWAVFSLLCLIGIGLLCVRLTGWKGDIFTWPAFMLLLGFGFPFTLAVWNGDLALLSAVLLLTSVLLLKKGRDGLAGIIFSLSLIKPPLLILILPYILLWVLIKGRWSFIINALGTILLLSGISWLLDPEWILAFLRQVAAASGEMTITSTQQIFELWMGPNGITLAGAFSFILGAYLLMEWGISFLNNDHHFLWTLGLTIVISTIIGLPTDLDHQVLFLLPILLTASAWEKRWQTSGRWLSLGFFLMLLIGNWALILGLAGSSTDSILWIYLILPIVLLGTLIWTRWWFLRLVELPGERWRSVRRGR